MVNENFREYKKHERDLKYRYIGDEIDNKNNKNKTNNEYNHQSNTDISVGATGRDPKLD